MLFYQLSRPLAYLRIKDESKAALDYWVPVFLAAATACLYVVLPERLPIFGQNGAISHVAGLLEILPGFYITALAAVSTFNRAEMDYLLPAPTPTVWIKTRGTWLEIELSRRRMLSLLFGYLAFISLLLFIITIAAIYTNASVQLLLGEAAFYAAPFFVFSYAFIFWNMIVITIFGLYQLCDRIHQPD